jgi:hypothetical protein
VQQWDKGARRNPPEEREDEEGHPVGQSGGQARLHIATRANVPTAGLQETGDRTIWKVPPSPNTKKELRIADGVTAPLGLGIKFKKIGHWMSWQLTAESLGTCGLKRGRVGAAGEQSPRGSNHGTTSLEDTLPI